MALPAAPRRSSPPQRRLADVVPYDAARNFVSQRVEDPARRERALQRLRQAYQPWERATPQQLRQSAVRRPQIEAGTFQGGVEPARVESRLRSLDRAVGEASAYVAGGFGSMLPLVGEAIARNQEQYRPHVNPETGVLEPGLTGPGVGRAERLLGRTGELAGTATSFYLLGRTLPQLFVGSRVANAVQPAATGRLASLARFSIGAAGEAADFAALGALSRLSPGGTSPIDPGAIRGDVVMGATFGVSGRAGAVARAAIPGALGGAADLAVAAGTGYGVARASGAPQDEALAEGAGFGLIHALMRAPRRPQELPPPPGETRPAQEARETPTPPEPPTGPGEAIPAYTGNPETDRRIHEFVRATEIPNEPAPAPKTDMPEAFLDTPGPETSARGYRFRTRFLPLESLISSNMPNYWKPLQERMRDRAGSAMQIDEIVNTFRPEEVLTDVGRLDFGPPIIGPDLMVESGNGRVMALRRLLAERPEAWAEYQRLVRQEALKAGVTEIPENAVLVRERLDEMTPEERVAFAELANKPVGLEKSPVEIALQDARHLSDAVVANVRIPEGESFGRALQKNRPLINSILGRLTANERNAIADEKGNMSEAFVARVENALLARALPGEKGQRLVARFIESREPGLARLREAVLSTVSRIAKADALSRSGSRPGTTPIGDDLAAVADALDQMRSAGLRPFEFINQEDILTGKTAGAELTSRQREMFEQIAENLDRPRVLREYLKAETDQIINGGARGQETLLQRPVAPERTLGPDDITENVGRREAERVPEIRFDGLWEGTRRLPPSLAFTDLETKSSFNVMPGQSVEGQLAAVRERHRLQQPATRVEQISGLSRRTIQGLKARPEVQEALQRIQEPNERLRVEGEFQEAARAANIAPAHQAAIQDLWRSIARWSEQTYGLPRDEFYRRLTVKASPETGPETLGGAARGQIEFLDGRSVITAFKNADASTFVHEIAHHARRFLSGDDAKLIDDWLLSQDVPRDRLRDMEGEELFAGAFERYLRDGEAPTSALKALFQKIRAFMLQVYRSVRGTQLAGFEISPQVRRLFDRMVTGGDLTRVLEPPEARTQSTLFQPARPATDRERVGVMDRLRRWASETLSPELRGRVRAAFTPLGRDVAGLIQEADSRFQHIMRRSAAERPALEGLPEGGIQENPALRLLTNPSDTSAADALRALDQQAFVTLRENMLGESRELTEAMIATGVLPPQARAIGERYLAQGYRDIINLEGDLLSIRAEDINPREIPEGMTAESLAETLRNGLVTREGDTLRFHLASGKIVRQEKSWPAGGLRALAQRFIRGRRELSHLRRRTIIADKQTWENLSRLGEDLLEGFENMQLEGGARSRVYVPTSLYYSDGLVVSFQPKGSKEPTRWFTPEVSAARIVTESLHSQRVLATQGNLVHGLLRLGRSVSLSPKVWRGLPDDIRRQLTQAGWRRVTIAARSAGEYHERLRRGLLDLSQHVMRPDVASALERFVDPRSDLARYLDKAVSEWKQMMTTDNPASHITQTIGNVIHGMAYLHFPWQWGRSIRAHTALLRGEQIADPDSRVAHQAYEESATSGGSFAIAGELRRRLGDPPENADWWQFMEWLRAGRRVMQEAWRIEDDVPKFSLFEREFLKTRERLRRTKSDLGERRIHELARDRAAEITDRVYPNFARLSPFVRNMARFIPFSSYEAEAARIFSGHVWRGAKNTAVLFRDGFQNREALDRWWDDGGRSAMGMMLVAGFVPVINAMVERALGITPEEKNLLRDQVGRWQMLLPRWDDKGNLAVATVPMQNLFPFLNYFDWRAQTNPTPNLLRTVASRLFSHPLVRIGGEIASNREWFTDQPLVQAGQPYWPTMADYLTRKLTWPWMGSGIRPVNLIRQRGPQGRIVNGALGNRDWLGQPQTLARGLRETLTPFRVQPIEFGRLRQRQRRIERARDLTITEQIRLMRRRRQRGQITADQYRREVQALRQAQREAR